VLFLVNGGWHVGEEADLENEADDAAANDEELLGGDVLEPVEAPVAVNGDDPTPSLPDDVVAKHVSEVAFAVDEASRELLDPDPAVPPPLPSSSSAAAAADDGVEVSTDGTIKISRMGYTSCTRPKFKNYKKPYIGLVVLYRDGKTLCGSCHVHPRCSQKVGRRRFAYT